MLNLSLKRVSCFSKRQRRQHTVVAVFLLIRELYLEC